MTRSSFISVLSFLAITSSYAQNKPTFTDPRDGNKYTFVTYENIQTPGGKPLIWMSQNLNFETDSGSFVYPYPAEEKNKSFGLLYTWQAATKACPAGWHLPTNPEWQQLIDTFGGNETAGRTLKSATGWDHNGHGENWSGFNAGPNGYYEVDDRGYSVYYSGLGQWWTATAVENDSATIRLMSALTDKVLVHTKPKANGYAVRCVKD